jgi:aryl-alcohol dehydrogenase-like predicted oxidoreductase
MRNQLSRQLLGLQRRCERDAHGQSSPRRLPRTRLPDEQDRWAEQEAAAQQIDESLHRLKTDRIDLMQMHEIIRMEDPDRCFEAGGGMEALIAARKAGKVRYIGFTGTRARTFT